MSQLALPGRKRTHCAARFDSDPTKAAKLWPGAFIPILPPTGIVVVVRSLGPTRLALSANDATRGQTSVWPCGLMTAKCQALALDTRTQ